MSKNSASGPGAKVETYADLGRYQSLRRFWLAIVILIAGGVLLFVSSAWRSEAAHDFIESFGLAFIGIAIMGRLWCTLYIGGRKAGEIVSAGPYSVSRNPLYVFSTIGAIGVGAQSGSLFITALFGVLCLFAFSIVAKREERFLTAQFPGAYPEYFKRVPRFFPRLSLYRDEPSLTVLPHRVYTTLVDGLVFFAALPAFELVEYLQDSGILPVLLRVY